MLLKTQMVSAYNIENNSTHSRLLALSVRFFCEWLARAVSFLFNKRSHMRGFLIDPCQNSDFCCWVVWSMYANHFTPACAPYLSWIFLAQLGWLKIFWILGMSNIDTVEIASPGLRQQSPLKLRASGTIRFLTCFDVLWYVILSMSWTEITSPNWLKLTVKVTKALYSF